MRHDHAASTDFEVVSDAPESFGDYELLGEIGAGGMGRVFKARQRSLDRVVALKTLRSRDFNDPALVQRFHKEAEAAAQLHHPTIVPVYEFAIAEGQFYFTMLLVDGIGLDERLRQGPLDNRTAASIVQQVAEAVAYAHRKGVVHRDLKPANILLDRDGSPKITDFGIARRLNIKDLGEIEPAVQAQYPEAVGTAIRLTEAGTILGTPGYMAPEQSRGTSRIGASADIWALGAVLYSCLTGRPPFVGGTALETLALTVDTEPVPPNEINPDADPELVEICLKCLEKEPADRYGSAEDVAAELARWREGRAVRSRWEIWRTKAARYVAGMPEIIPLVGGLIVHRFGNIQEGLFVGALLAGIGLSQRRKHWMFVVLPAIAMLLPVLSLPLGRVGSEAMLWRAGAIVSVAGLLAVAATLANGLFAVETPRSSRSSPRTIACVCLLAGLISIGFAILAMLIREQTGSQSLRITAVADRIFERTGGWFFAVPLGLAVGAIVGQVNRHMDRRFGRESLPAFAFGAALFAIMVAYALSELRPASITEASRFEVLGPGPALSTAEDRAADWMSDTGTAPAVARRAAAAGIFWLKLLFYIVPMALGGMAASLIMRSLDGGKR